MTKENRSTNESGCRLRVLDCRCFFPGAIRLARRFQLRLEFVHDTHDRRPGLVAFRLFTINIVVVLLQTVPYLSDVGFSRTRAALSATFTGLSLFWIVFAAYSGNGTMALRGRRSPTNADGLGGPSYKISDCNPLRCIKFG